MMHKTITINEHSVGENQPCFIIAEAGVNHNGSLDTARDMVQVAAQSGANAVKFQTFKAGQLTTAQALKADYQKKNTDTNETQLDMLRKLELSLDAYPVLMEECRIHKIIFMSTPFEEESADMLDALGMPAFKIPSGEITNLPFLIHIANKGKPIILSTGMSYLSEVDVAVRTIFSMGNQNLALLHCTSNYPANPAGINLRAMDTLAHSFQLPVGFSDHSEGIEISLAAVAMGASIIEKHFTLDRTLPGPDQHTSLEPKELEVMVKGIRKVELALGHGRKEPAESEADTAAVARKSIVAQNDIPAGKQIMQSDISMMRPGTGLPPSMLTYVVGRVARVDIPAGALLNFGMFK